MATMMKGKLVEATVRVRSEVTMDEFLKLTRAPGSESLPPVNAIPDPIPPPRTVRGVYA